MNNKKKNSSSQRDRLSSLPDILLIMIISCLPFKKSTQTSVLSKRWRNLCHQTKNIAFKEPEYMCGFDSNRFDVISFVHYMRQWVSRFRGEVIESFEIHLSNPVGLGADIEYLIEFAVSRHVRKLVLDFSNPIWRTIDDVSWRDVAIELPACIYNQRSLESLYIYACGFEPLKFANPELLISLGIGWIGLRNVESLLSKCPLLESLSIKCCWELDIMLIKGRIKELVIENCDFPLMFCSFDLPNIDIFKYSGYIICLDFEKMNTMIKEVYLNFGVEREYDDEPTESDIAQGEIVCNLLNDLRSAKTLTVCPYLLQVIQECQDQDFMLHDLEAQHLVLRTKLHPKEFMGIGKLLDNCMGLKTLTFDYVPPRPSFSPRDLSYRGIDPRTHWLQNISYRCLIKTLKVVVFRNFIGGCNQLDVLSFLVRTGRGNVRSLERVDLYVPNGLNEDQVRVAREGAAMLQRTTNRARVIVQKTCDANGHDEDIRPIRICKPNPKYIHD